MSKTCVVVGVGKGNGEALVRKFSEQGYRVAMIARSADYLNSLEQQIPGARGFSCDITEPQQVQAAFQSVEKELGCASVVIYNAGGGAFKSVEDASFEEFEASWKVNVLGLTAVAKAVLPQLRQHPVASLLITSASAATRGRANTAPFASAKAAQRSLAQSLARQLGPERIHVALMLIDGVVDLPRTRTMLPDKPEDFFVKPSAVADTAWALCQQDPSAWTFELDVRPFGETW